MKLVKGHEVDKWSRNLWKILVICSSNPTDGICRTYWFPITIGLSRGIFSMEGNGEGLYSYPAHLGCKKEICQVPCAWCCGALVKYVCLSMLAVVMWLYCVCSCRWWCEGMRGREQCGVCPQSKCQSGEPEPEATHIWHTTALNQLHGHLEAGAAPDVSHACVSSLSFVDLLAIDHPSKSRAWYFVARPRLEKMRQFLKISFLTRDRVN